MTSEARKRANLKYQSTKARIVIWCDPEEKKEVERRAIKAGKSLNAYCKDKIIGAE